MPVSLANQGEILRKNHHAFLFALANGKTIHQKESFSMT